ncbi:hypothetical protein ACFOX0_33275, partial [Micromonospora zhanjiangensis]
YLATAAASIHDTRDPGHTTRRSPTVTSTALGSNYQWSFENASCHAVAVLVRRVEQSTVSLLTR